MMARICLPPGPITFPIDEGSIVNFASFGTVSGRVSFDFGRTSSILSRMCNRPTLACSRARSIVARLKPSHLISNWNVVIPVRSPATLKSIVPSASSVPKISERINASSSETPSLSFKSIPIAIPATGFLIGTPESINARHPPHTLAIDEDPWDSVIRDSTRIEYGKSSSDGKVGISARSAKFPCPISRRPGAPVRPVSPTHDGGKVYCR
mmetsp:Transcript_19021/g.39143  ORF Transcript_19021/g.39143 Transcript_19021/m.39143 type:complete len:210 (-) Transcript_19021:888-1517(-)